MKEREKLTLSLASIVAPQFNPIPHEVFWITHTWGGADSARLL